MERVEMFLRHVEKTETCWLWTGGTVTGYGHFGYGTRTGPAHRWSYEHFVAPIPTGLWIDHLCHSRDRRCPGGSACGHRRCVRPDHLEPVTPAENQRRRHARSPDRTHCRYKHRLPEGYPRGKRCPACSRGYLLPPEVEQAIFDKETPMIERAAAATDLKTRVAERLAKTSTYVDVEQDIVDGLLSDVIEAVRAELAEETS